MPKAGQRRKQNRKTTTKTRLNKIRCRVCKSFFVPKRPDIVTCSPSCSAEYHAKLRLDRYHRLHPDASYGKRNAKGKPKPAKDTKKKAASSFLDTKVDRRSDRSKIRDLLRSPDADNSLSKADKAAVERVMALPYGERWKGGAKNWSPEQRKYAQRIEMKRISSDFSSAMESNERKDFGPPSMDEPRKKKRADLPYKYDPLDDESDTDDELAAIGKQSSESDASSGDSTADDDDSGASDCAADPFAALAAEDDEIDATDEENQA